MALTFVECAAGCGTRYLVNRFSTVPHAELERWVCPVCDHDTDPDVLAMHLARLARRVQRTAA